MRPRNALGFLVTSMPADGRDPLGRSRKRRPAPTVEATTRTVDMACDLAARITAASPIGTVVAVWDHSGASLWESVAQEKAQAP